MTSKAIFNRLNKCYRAVWNGNDNAATWAKIGRLTEQHDKAIAKESELAPAESDN